jgi:hypothetical protein
MKFSKIIAFAGMFAGFSGAMFFSAAVAVHAATIVAVIAPVTSAVSIPVASAATTTKATVIATTTVSAPIIPLSDCGLTDADVAKIAAIQNDPTLNWSQEVTQELAMRKQLIGKTIACAQANVTALQTALAKTPASGDAANSIQAQLQSRLNDAANFYTIELGKLNGAGISGSQSIASEILAWRVGTYAPLSGQVNNFILWAGNQNLFSTAQTRMNQTQQAVSFFENASANSDLQSAFTVAYASFQTAKDDNASAQAALAQSLPPAQSLALVKKSLDDLSDTYQKFYAVSDIIKTLLPQ